MQFLKNEKKKFLKLFMKTIPPHAIYSTKNLIRSL